MSDDPWQPINPFDSETYNVYELTSAPPVDANGLQDDVSRATGVDVNDLMVATSIEDPDSPSSSDNPTYVFVASRTPIDQADIQSILDGHEPPQSDVATTPTGVVITSDDPDLPDVLDKLRAGSTLTTKELSLVLKSVLGG